MSTQENTQIDNSDLTSIATENKKSRFGKITIIATTTFVVTGLLAIGIIPRLHKQSELNAFAKSTNKKVPTVNVTKPKLGEKFTELVLPSTIQASQETTIYARTSGYLQKRTVDIGDRVNSGHIRINVPQAFVQSIHTGETALVSVRELPKKSFSGKVIQTSDVLDATSNTLLTEIEVQNADNVLRPGMYAEVKFKTERANPPLLVPSNTLVINADGVQVATVTKENKVKYKKVELGRDYGTQVEVVSGLNPNAKLITNPTDSLQDGKPVKAIASKKGKKPKN